MRGILKARTDITEEIISLCRLVEKKHNVKILFAIENGSRAWRMESKNSDYDVRFVYHYPIEQYISLKKPKEVIEITKGDIDMVGFDVFKYVSLLSKSNPTAIEWLVTDIIYYGKQSKNLVKFAKTNFNPVALYNHYKSLSKNNYLKYIKSGNHITYKKYLYTLRGLINAIFVLENDKIPPIILLDAVKSVNIPKSLKEKIAKIVEIKKKGKEQDTIQNIALIDNYVERFLKQEPKLVVRHSDISMLDHELKKLILTTRN